VLDALEEGIEQEGITEEDVTVDKLKGFLSGFGRAFYRFPDAKGEKFVLRRQGDVIVNALSSGSLEVVPFRRGQTTWKVDWR
jgi:dihydroorotase